MVERRLQGRVQLRRVYHSPGLDSVGLRHQRMIEGRGRSGSWVTGDTIGPRPARTGTSGLFGDDVLDLSLSVPDTAVLPPLDKALRHAAGARNLHSYERTPILDSLRLAVEQRWPYEPETFLATNGGYNAFYSVVHALIMPGATVAIEDPTAMRLLDILEDRKCTYKAAGLQYYRPWILLLTDGQANLQGLDAAVSRLNAAETARGVTVFAVGAGPHVDWQQLSRVSVQRSPAPLDGLRYEELFEWLSASLSNVSNSTEFARSDQALAGMGDQIKLPPLSGWSSV